MNGLFFDFPHATKPDHGELRWKIAGRDIRVPYTSIEQRRVSLNAVESLIEEARISSKHDLDRVPHVEDRSTIEIMRANGMTTVTLDAPTDEANPYAEIEALRDANGGTIAKKEYAEMTDRERKAARAKHLKEKAAEWAAKKDAEHQHLEFHRPGTPTRGLFERAVDNAVSALLDSTATQREVDALYNAYRQVASGKAGFAEYKAAYEAASQAQLDRIADEKATLSEKNRALTARQARIEQGRIDAPPSPPDRPYRTLPDGSRQYGKRIENGIGIKEFVPDEVA